MGLSLLSPWFLLGAAAVAVPIALHLLARHTAPDLQFPTTRFVPEAPVEQRRRRRPTDWLLLALRCAALLLLALAFARPYVAGSSAADQAPVRLVALDTSFSMASSATWAAAQEAAAAAIEQAPPGTLVGAVALDEVARVVSPPSVDRGAARAALAALRPGPRSTDYGALAGPAGEWLAGRAGDVVLVTDRQRSALRGTIALPPGAVLAVSGVPPARANLAVESLVRDGADVVATLVNHGLERRPTLATLAIDGAEVARREVALDEAGRAVVRFADTARPAGVATLRVDDAGGLPADDERHLVLDEPRPTLVWVVGGQADAFYVERALASVRRVPRVAVRVVSWDDVAAVPAREAGPDAAASRPDVVVVQSTRGLAEPARLALAAFLDGGGGVFVAAGPDVEAGALSQAFGAGRGVAIARADAVPLPTVLAPVDVRHAVFTAYADRASAYAGIRFDTVVRLQPDDADQVLARFDNGLAALVERRVGRGRVLVLASDLGGQWNGWPLSPSFLPFLHDAVAHLAAREADARQFLVGETPAGVAPAPGAHLLADGRRVAVNVDARESVIDLVTDEEVAAAVVEAPEGAPAASRAVAEEAAQAWWWYLVAAVLAVMVVEGAVGGRAAARGRVS